MFLIVTVAALVPRLATAGENVIFDENLWMLRSQNFSDAITSGEFSRAHSAFPVELATMPGITNMWIGSIARGIYALFDLGDGESFNTSRAGLIMAERLVAVVTSLLIGGIALAVRRWAGTPAAWLAGAVLVGEAWLTGLSGVFHTDALLTLFGVLGLVLLAVAFEVPGRAERVQRPMLAAALGGAFIVGSPLTKLTGLTFGLGAIAVIALSLWDGRADSAVRTLRLKQLAAAAGAAVAVVVVSYPAIWASTGEQIDLLRTSANLGDTPQKTVFRGRVVETPGPTFFFYVIPFRATPWVFLGALAAIPLALRRAEDRRRLLVLAAVAAPTMIMISTASKQNDRYALPIIALGAVLFAVVVGPMLERRYSKQPATRVRWIGVSAVVVMSLWNLVVAPWGLLYFSPLLGGGERAQDTFWFSNLEASQLVSPALLELENGDCSETTVAWQASSFVTDGRPPDEFFDLPCNPPSTSSADADYVIGYLGERTKAPDRYRRATANRELVKTVTVRGVDVLEIWR